MTIGVRLRLPPEMRVDILVHWYHINIMPEMIERVQTGVRIEKKLLKVLKGLAEHLDISLGDLLEGMSLHCFENKPPFSGETLKKIEQLKQVYDFELTASNSHDLKEDGQKK